MKEEQQVSKSHTKLLTEDLEYPTLTDWTDAAIFKYLKENVMSVPGTISPKGAHFFTVQSSTLGKVSITAKYRLPLLWINKWLWQSLYLILTTQKDQWETQKLHLLHISRLCNRLLEAAKKTITGCKADRKWRCPVFDRVLARFWDHQFCCDPRSVQEYPKKKEPKDDVLKRNWKSWVAVGFNGFRLVADEMAKGITADEYTNGLKQVGGNWIWTTTNTRYSSTHPKLVPVKPPSLTISIPSPKRVVKPAEKDSQIVEPPPPLPPPPSCVPPKVAARAKFQRSNSSTPLSQAPAQIAASQAPIQIVVSQAPAQIAASQAPIQIVVSQAPAHIAVSQAPIQIAVSQAPAQIAVSQAPKPVPAPIATSPPLVSSPTQNSTTQDPNFLLEAMQSQLTGLFTLVDSLKSEQTQLVEDQRKLGREYSEIQLEIRTLKRRVLVEDEMVVVMKKRRTEGTHPLSHLIDIEESMDIS